MDIVVFARYVMFVQNSPELAFLWSASKGIVLSNRADAGFFKDGVRSDGFAQAAQQALGEKRASHFSFGGQEILMVPLLEASGRASLVLGTAAHDIGDLPRLLFELHEGSWYFPQIIHVLPQIVLSATSRGMFDFASRRWFEVTGSSYRSVDIARSITTALGEQAAMFERLWTDGVRSGRAFSFEIQLKTCNGLRWFDLQATPWREDERLLKWVVILGDIQDEVALRHEVDRSQRQWLALSAIGSTQVDRTLTTRQMVERSLELAASAVGGVWFATFSNPDPVSIVYPSSAAASVPRPPIGAIGTCSFIDGAETHRRVVLYHPPEPAIVEDFAIGIASEEGVGSFGDAETAFLREVAHRLGSAIQIAKQYAREHSIAQNLQQDLLPGALAESEGLVFEADYRSAESAALVGGDWFDSFELPNGSIAFSVGDVAGHGIRAAIVMAHARESLRSLAMQGYSPADVLAIANRMMTINDRGTVTAFLGYLDPLTLSLECASAGHPPPYVVSAAGQVREITARGILFGAEPKAAYENCTLQLERSSAIFAYTDGLIEFKHDALEGARRLQHALAAWGRLGFLDSASDVVSDVLAAAVPTDDIAALAIRVLPVSSLNATIPSTPLDAWRARVAIQGVLGERVHEERSADFVLAMAEAINNGVQHGALGPSDRVRFTVKCEANELSGSVSSRAGWGPPAKGIERGRGVPLMRALVDDIDFETGDDGTTVTLFVRPRNRFEQYV